MVDAIEPKRRSDEFVVASDKFGVTITHPPSESQVRVVEREHRYKPEEWTFETLHWPNEPPAICYNLVKGPDGGVDEILIATGPGAWVEISEPAPYEGAKETQLTEEWERGLHPLRFGTFEPVVESEPGVIPEPDASPIPTTAGQPATAAAEQELENVVGELGGPRQGYAVRICDDSTVIETPTSIDNAGISARHAGGAETNVQTRTIWVHESVVRENGIVRPWGARLNLKQAVAHEMGHVETGQIQCTFASRAGADLPGLTEAERLGLLEDAAHIAEREGIAFESLKFPPGFEPPE